MRDVTVIENETATFVCEPSRTNADVKWFKDGEEINLDDKKFSSVLDGKKLRLVIAGAQLSDAGVYSCEVDGKSTSASLIVEGIFIKSCFETISISDLQSIRTMH